MSEDSNKQAKRRTRFFPHLLFYILALLVLGIVAFAGNLWILFVIVMGVWSLVLIAHACYLFVSKRKGVQPTQEEPAQKEPEEKETVQ